MPTTPLHYATYFDRYYVTRGVALYRSLDRHSPPFVLWILCLDDETYQMLVPLGLEHVRLIPLAELEKADPALLPTKAERLSLEYYWTCGPAFLCYLFQREPGIQMLTYLDADMFFFDSPAPLYEELGDGSVLMIEHHTTRIPGDTRRQGLFNVGLLVFRRTTSGLACLCSWREQCLEWCFDLYENDRYGDQLYLDAWPERFQHVAVSRYQGAGIGPWNVGVMSLHTRQGRVLVGHSPVIYYHFSKVRRISRSWYELHDWRFNRQRLGRTLRRHVYGPYVRELFLAERQIRKAWGPIPTGTQPRRGESAARRRTISSTQGSTLFYRMQRFMFVAGVFAV